MESISRISGLLETARDLTLEAARDASALRKPASSSIPTAQLRKLLDSRNEREVLEGLRRVITLSHRNPPPTGPPLLFSSVLKNIANPSIPVKKLVYIYLLEHAEAEPDTALLAINTIQKTLSATDPHLRALALRVMSGIRVPVISQIVSLAIKKGSTDISPVVRKAAALAIPKCWRLDPATSPQLVEYMSVLLGDKQYFVSGAAVMAFMQCCPERIELIHKHYRSLVRKLVDMDEWGQLATLRCMTIYARRCFPRRTKRVKKVDGGGGVGGVRGAAWSQQKSTSSTKGFYDDEEEEGEEGETNERASDANTPATPPPPTGYTESTILDPDLTLLLKAALPLLQSRNSAVITAVTRLYLYLAPPPTSEQESSATEQPAQNYLTHCTGPLISLLRSPLDIQQIALHSILRVALANPLPFLPYTTHFLLRSTDPARLGTLKLEILSVLFPHAPPHLQSLILSELSHSFRAHSAVAPNNTSPNTPAGAGAGAQTEQTPPLLTASVLALGRCAATSAPNTPTSRRCLSLLLSQLHSPSGSLVSACLTAIRHLIQADPLAHAATVTRLAKTLDTVTDARARATVVWLVGEFAAGRRGEGGEGNVAADVLRVLCKGFADEKEEVKLQIVLLAAKVYLHHLNDEQQQRQEQQNPDQDPDEPTKPSSSPIPLLYNYILHLTRYDPSYPLRTRLRFYKALLSSPKDNTQLATLLLLAPKPAPQTSATHSEGTRHNFTLGSASQVVGEDAGMAGRGFSGYEGVPEWVVEGREPDAKLREEEIGASPGYGGEYKGFVSASERLDAVVGSGAGPMFGRKVVDMEGFSGGPVAVEKSLDDWLAEEEDGDVRRGGREEEGSEGESSEEGSSEEESEEETDDEETEEDEDKSSEDERDERANLVG